MHHYHHHYYRYISDKQSQVFIKSRPLIFRIKSPRKQCCWLISLSCVWQVREGMWLKYQIFIQNVRKLRGPLSAIQKFLFATFFYPIFSKPFFGDFFGDFLLATFFPRYVLSDCFFLATFCCDFYRGLRARYVRENGDFNIIVNGGL